MKHLMTVMYLACGATVLGAARIEVSSLPEPVRPLAEVETNVAFSVAVSPTCFDPSWNMARIVSRGAGSLNVDSRMSVDAFLLRIR